jgi:hypothetical protein
MAVTAKVLLLLCILCIPALNVDALPLFLEDWIERYLHQDESPDAMVEKKYMTMTDVEDALRAQARYFDSQWNQRNEEVDRQMQQLSKTVSDFRIEQKGQREIVGRCENSSESCRKGIVTLTEQNVAFSAAFALLFLGFTCYFGVKTLKLHGGKEN